MIQYKPCRLCGAEIQLTQWHSQSGVCVPRCREAGRNETSAEPVLYLHPEIPGNPESLTGTPKITVENSVPVEPAPLPEEESASREPRRFLTADEVLGGWHAYITRRGKEPDWRLREPGSNAPKPVEAEGGKPWHQDDDYTCFLKVEKFFLEHFWWVYSKPLLALSFEADWKTTFMTWYAADPVPRGAYVVTSKQHARELEPHPIERAVDLWNDLTDKERGGSPKTTYSAARKAAEQGRLTAWSRPKMTTLADIQRWLSAHTHGGKRDGSGRKRAA